MSISVPTTAGHRPPLATPALAEAEVVELGQQLENYLASLVTYCDRQVQAPEQFDTASFRHAHELRQALDALLRYDAATARLLDYYRAALAYAQQQAEACCPTLEQVLGVPIPVPSATSLADRVARPSHPASRSGPRVDIAAVQRFLDQPALRARAQLPATQRQALANISAHHLSSYAQPREAQAQAD